MSWKKVKLGNFLNVRDNRFKPNDKAISHLRRIEKIDFSGEIFISDKPSNTDMILIKKGDLVISGINVEKGAMAVYTGEEDITATIHYSSYSFDENTTDIEFLKSFLKSIEFKNALKEQVPGGIKTEIKPKHLLPLIVEIPTDIKDQREVVKLLQSRNTKVDAISTELTHQLTLVKKLRQQFLQDAVQGKLVEQNESRKLSGETASELLKKIKAEKEKLIAENLPAGKAGKLKKEKELPPIKPEDLPAGKAGIPFEIPENWVWCRLGEISYITSGSTPSQTAFVESGIPYLKMYNLRNQKIDFFHKPQYIKEDVHNGQLKRCRAYSGDIIMNIVGPPLGKIAIIPDDLPECNFNQAAVLIRPLKKEMNHFIFWYLNELSEIRAIETKGVAGQDNISVTQAHNMRVPLPPLAEQNRIVQKLDELMQYCDELEASIKQSQAQNEKLLQQVLREALRSVPQNAGKEPVEV